VTTCAVSSRLVSSPTTSTYLPSLADYPDTLLDPMVTQTLELHHQNGTVRTVTIPKPYPIQVVSDYRLVKLDHIQKSHVQTVVTSGWP
jgi:hypothetical protein